MPIVHTGKNNVAVAVYVASCPYTMYLDSRVHVMQWWFQKSLGNGQGQRVARLTRWLSFVAPNLLKWPVVSIP